MKVAPYPADEQARLAALYALKVLDTPPEERFDRVTRLAQRLLNVPVVLISLVDADRQWFKSRQGLDVDQTRRDVAFCSHAILGSHALIVRDALEDARFADNPLVTGKPHIRFYVGYPISSPDGLKVGTLCAIDRVPRELSDEDLRLLADLAQLAENELHLNFFATQEQDRAKKLNEMIKTRTAQAESANAQLRQESAALRRVDELLHAVLETVGEAIVAVDIDGNIATVNDEVSVVFGYEPEDLVGLPGTVLVPPEYRHQFTAGLHGDLTRGGNAWISRRAELLGRHKSGATFPLEFRVRETRLAEGMFFTFSFRDISERKQIEQLRDDFVSTVSHELRTPLASVMGWTETLLSERPGPLSDKQRQFLQIVYRSSQRLDSLVEEILTVSRIHSGTLELNCEPFFPTTVLNAARELVAATAAMRKVAILFDDQWPPALSCIGDRKRMEQVIVNLLENAIKFSPADSEVFVSSFQDGNLWRLQILDHGIGIAAEEIPLVFDRFYRSESVRTAQIQGTGIGLYICKAVVEGHHGQISITSELGQGTEISLAIPRQ